MFLRPDDQPARRTALALRVAVLGGFALAMFSVIFFRLWYLEVLSGDHYLARRTTTGCASHVQAPRGEILDRDGKVLVDNRTGMALQVDSGSCPATGRSASTDASRRARRNVAREHRATIRESGRSPPAPGDPEAGLD